MFLVQQRRRFLPSLLLALVSATLSAQAPQTSIQTPVQTPALSINARLVVLDVVVTDAKGNVVNDLTEKDFQVFEDGKRQRIRSVEPPSAHTLPATSASSTTVFDPAKPASFGLSPVTLLVLDQLNTHFADASFARQQLHDYLSKQPATLAQPTTLLSVFDDHFKLQQGFTRDRDALLHTLDAAPTQYAWKLEVNGKAEHGPIERLDQSLRALEEMAESYARIPGRKNLIWVGGGFPNLDPATVEASDLREVKAALHHVTNLMLDARVTLYAIDPTTTLPGMTEITDASQMAFMMAGGDAVSGDLDTFGVHDSFDALGPLTGGRVIRGMNDVGAQIGRAVESGANFYTMAYSPDSASQAKSSFRNIRVVCLRPGLTVATRNGYFVESANPKESLANATYDLTTAAESTVPLNGLQVSVASEAPGLFTVHVSAPGLSWQTKSDGGATASVYVMAVSLNAKNKMLAHTLLGMTATAKPGAHLTEPSRRADFEFPTTAAPKATTLRFIVRDSATGRMGSFDLPLK